MSVIVIPPCSVVNGQITPCVKPQDQPIAEYVDIVRLARIYGIKVLSYVWTDYGRRPSASIKAEITKAKANYNLDGIFLDGVAADIQSFPYYSDLSIFVRAGRGGFVALNPGVVPSTQSYMQIADLVVTFEGTYETYVKATVPAPWMSAYPATKFWHLVHAVPATSAAHANAIRLSELRNAGSIYMTDDKLPNPWDSLPGFFTSELSLMTTSCG